MSALDQLRARLGDRYTIERELGRGGMGAVYLARDLRLDRPVALKVMPSEYAVLPALRERFLRETRLAASFSHPNIVPVYAVEEAQDLLAYAMGFVEGESLAERVRRAGALSVRDTVRLVQDVGYALAYAHGRGVVHRDIKPDNVMIERATGRALVMDFGIARTIAAPAVDGPDGLTRVGEVVGTPEYMSPEQATGDHVDGRSDLYSLGLTAYFALTGHPAMTGDTTGKVLAKQITELLPPMATVRADLPPALAAALDRCVVKDPDARFANAEALIEALDAAQLTAPPIPVPVRLFANELATLSLIVAGGAVLLFFLGRAMLADPENNGDTLLPLILAASVLLTRVMQSRAEARRLAVDGFSAGDVHRGFLAIMAERDGRRAELRASDRIRAARRRTVRWAVLQLIGTAVTFRLALHFRTRVAPHQYSITWVGTVLVVASTIMLGVGLSLLTRTPLRMPIGERLFRLVWIGPLGRAFVRSASARLARRTLEPVLSTGNARPTSNGERASDGRSGTMPAAVLPPDTAINRVAQLEQRVAALERWRNDS